MYSKIFNRIYLKGNTSPSNEYTPGQQSEEELKNGLERLIELAKLFQLHNLRKRFIFFFFKVFLYLYLFRLETIKQSRQRNSTDLFDESIGQIKQRYHYTREAL